MTYTRIIACIIALLFCRGTLAADLFTVDDIKVSSTAANANQAKESATLEGQRQAFAKLLERIAVTQQPIPDIEPENLAQMVQGIEVNDEKVTATYYSATLSISFNRALVDKFLQEKNINFTSKKSAPIVIVPVLLGESTFEGSNPWRNALTSVTSANHVLSVTVIPSLRGADKAKITMNISNLDSATKDELLKIGQSYNADRLILAVAMKNSDNLIVHMQDIKDPQSEVKEIAVIASDLQSDEDIFMRAAKNITSLLEGQWVKGKNEDNSSALTKTTITVVFANLDEWGNIQKKLTSLGFLKNVSVKSINVKYALVDISFKDTSEGLAEKMLQNGLSLEKNGENIILHVR